MKNEKKWNKKVVKQKQKWEENRRWDDNMRGIEIIKKKYSME